MATIKITLNYFIIYIHILLFIEIIVKKCIMKIHKMKRCGTKRKPKPKLVRVFTMFFHLSSLNQFNHALHILHLSFHFTFSLSTAFFLASKHFSSLFHFHTCTTLNFSFFLSFFAHFFIFT
jgi:hypothetical protein